MLWRQSSWRLRSSVLALAKRSLSTGTSSSTATPTSPSSSSALAEVPSREAVVRVRGDVPYGSREYLLLPPDIALEEVKLDPSLILASLRAHRNILFAAKVHHTNNDKGGGGGGSTIVTASDDDDVSSSTLASFIEICSPLVHAALQDASDNGEQPQALATLHGLSAWVEQQLPVLSNDDETGNNAQSDLPNNERFSTLWKSFSKIERGAVRAIATGIPRPGHSVVGMGTYDEGAMAWTALAKEFVIHQTDDQEEQRSSETALYQSMGGQLIQIEHLADRQPDYLKSAGGAMARFVFF